MGKLYKVTKNNKTVIVDAESAISAVRKVLDNSMKDSFSPNQMVTYKPDGDAPMRVKIVKKLTEAEKKAQAGKINPNAGDYYEVEYSSTALGTSRWIVWEGRLKDSAITDAGVHQEQLAQQEYEKLKQQRKAIEDEIDANDNNPRYNIKAAHDKLEAIDKKIADLKKQFGYALKDSLKDAYNVYEIEYYDNHDRRSKWITYANDESDAVEKFAIKFHRMGIEKDNIISIHQTNKITDSEKCVICGKEIQGYGNNAEPVKSGKCCDLCNQKVVIPARLEAIKNTNSKPIDDDRLSPMTYAKLKELGYNSDDWKDWDQEHANEVVAKGRKEDPNKNTSESSSQKYSKTNNSQSNVERVQKPKKLNEERISNAESILADSPELTDQFKHGHTPDDFEDEDYAHIRETYQDWYGDYKLTDDEIKEALERTYEVYLDGEEDPRHSEKSKYTSESTLQEYSKTNNSELNNYSMPTNIERIAKRTQSYSGYTPTNEGMLRDFENFEDETQYKELLGKNEYYRYYPEDLNRDAMWLKSYVDKLKQLKYGK